MSEIGTGLQNATGIRNGVARAGYAFVEASDMRNALLRFGTLADWPHFAESWNDLEVDTYMGGGASPSTAPASRARSCAARTSRTTRRSTTTR